ncbi:hypothetical protein K469DRAFT_723769 [Zopfia rhizophila CBS 207.26]|uniref:HNH nuclease domain-containing protein n=1 Tax=Zopfia rhizophila CBS 207.26 TaxID=1314779 RepID=A0A6A6DC55_9PEZI|nr:hypothetical protein K469DRAFT_723769 [Zopfia rhizophila CBS 207.26]
MSYYKYKTPSHEDGEQNLPIDLNHRVYLCYSGYSDTGNILMVLPALDHPQGGIHHETARITCAIIINNRWEEFLTEIKTGGRTAVSSNSILRGKNYYFWVSKDTTNKATLARDVSCRITDYTEGTEHVHLVPRRSEPVDNTQNAIFLHSNIHTIFDQKRFMITPKSSILLIHILALGSLLQLMRLYHNYILAQFTWIIFAQSINFMLQGLKRRLFIYISNREISILDLLRDQCRQLLSFGAKSIFMPSAAGGEDARKEKYFQSQKRQRSFDTSLS